MVYDDEMYLGNVSTAHDYDDWKKGNKWWRYLSRDVSSSNHYSGWTLYSFTSAKVIITIISMRTTKQDIWDIW